MDTAAEVVVQARQPMQKISRRCFSGSRREGGLASARSEGKRLYVHGRTYKWRASLSHYSYKYFSMQ